LDGLVLDPGDVFSFWNRVGEPSARRGSSRAWCSRAARSASPPAGPVPAVEPAVLDGPARAVRVVEHNRHGFDAFPDDRRVLPFGSGATVFFNYGDLRLRNPTDRSLQLHVWLTDTELCGQIRADRPWPLATTCRSAGTGSSATRMGACSGKTRSGVARWTGGRAAR